MSTQIRLLEAASQAGAGGGLETCRDLAAFPGGRGPAPRLTASFLLALSAERWFPARNAMTVASWLLVVDPGGRLVVVTESPEGRGPEPVHDALLAVPGVRSAALVAAFEEGEEDRK